MRDDDVRSACFAALDLIASVSRYGSRGSSQPDSRWQLCRRTRAPPGCRPAVDDGENEEIDAVRSLIATLDRARHAA